MQSTIPSNYFFQKLFFFFLRLLSLVYHELFGYDLILYLVFYSNSFLQVQIGTSEAGAMDVCP